MTSESSATNYNTLAYGESPDDGPSTKEVAKDQAAGVAGSAREAGQHVAGVVKDEAGNVAGETTRQVRDVLGQTRTEISRQAADQQQRVAGGLRSLGSELDSMAEHSDESSVASDLARQASARANDLADWLEQRDPGSLVAEVKTFARRRPGTFLAIAVGAGLAAGRLTRGLKDESSRSYGDDVRSGSSTPSYPTPGGHSSATTEYVTPTTGYNTATGEYVTGGEYGTSGRYGTGPGDEVGVEPSVPPERVAERQYPQSGSPLDEERRP